MGDEDGGAALPGVGQVVQDGPLGLGVHGGDGVVQDQDGGVFHQGPGDGDALLLPAGHGDAPLPQYGVVPQGEVLHVAVHVRQGGRDGHPLPVGDGLGEVDVPGDGVAEQEIVLGHVGGGPAHVPDGDGVHVMAVDEQRPVGHVAGAQDQVYHRGLARPGAAHDAHPLARPDGKGHVPQGVELPVGVAEGEVPELHVPPHLPQGPHVRAVGHVPGGVQQGGDPLQGGPAPAGHVDELGDGHDGPDDGGEVADELHQLPGVEVPPPHQPAAVAQDDADHRLHKQGHQNPQQHRRPGEVHVGPLVLPVEPLEGQQLLGLLHEGLDDGNAGKALLGEVGQLGKGLLPDVPLLHHVFAHHRAGRQQQGHGDHGQPGHHRVHAPHLDHRQASQQQRVEEHEEAGAVAVLHRLQVVGEQAHEAAHLVLLVELPGQVLGVVEHLVPQAGLHLDGRAEDADPPQKAAHHHGDDDPHHGQADPVQQEVQVEGEPLSVHLHPAQVYAVDHLLVQVGDDELDIVHQHQGGQPQQQPSGVFDVIFIDVCSEYHGAGSSSQGARPPDRLLGLVL